MLQVKRCEVTRRFNLDAGFFFVYSDWSKWRQTIRYQFYNRQHACFTCLKHAQALVAVATCFSSLNTLHPWHASIFVHFSPFFPPPPPFFLSGNQYVRSFDGAQFRFLYRNLCSSIVVPPLTKGAGPILGHNGLYRQFIYNARAERERECVCVRERERERDLP